MNVDEGEDMIGHNSNLLDADAISHRMEALGHEWADKHAAAQLLEDTEKSVLAEFTLEFRAHTKTMAEAEARARAYSKFREHVEATAEARRLANRARVTWDSYRAWYEMQRTNASTERQLMGMR